MFTSGVLQGSKGWFWVASPAMRVAGSYNLSATVENEAVEGMSESFPLLEVLPGPAIASSMRCTCLKHFTSPRFT